MSLPENSLFTILSIIKPFCGGCGLVGFRRGGGCFRSGSGGGFFSGGRLGGRGGGLGGDDHRL